jgi:hypothetical protein
VGLILRAWSGDGTPLENSNGSWHRDVFLEEVGFLTGLLPMDRTPLDLPLAELARALFQADLIVLAGAFGPDGAPLLNPDSGAWRTEALLIDLVPADDDLVDGGKATTSVRPARKRHAQRRGRADPFRGQRGQHHDPSLRPAPNRERRAPDRHRRRGGGAHRLRTAAPSWPTCSWSDELAALEPQLTLYTDVNPALLEIALGDRLSCSDGTQLEPYIQLVPDVVHHPDALPGNDLLRGDAGDDLIFADPVTMGSPLVTGLTEIDRALGELTEELSELLAWMRHVALDYDLYERVVLGVQSPSVVVIGCDTVDGGTGNDTIVGYEAALLDPWFIRFEVPAGEFKQPCWTHRFLRDLEYVAVD